MLNYKTGVAGARSAAVAMANYLTEATVPTAEAQLAAYYAQDRGQEEALAIGTGTPPMPRRDMDPELAAILGVQADKALSVAEFSNILQGLRADGTDLPITRPAAYKPRVNGDGVEVGTRQAIAYMDFVFSAPKSVSVAWAFAPEAERQSIMQANRTARDLTLAYIEREIAKAGFGKGHREGEEAGRFTWFSCDHYTSRPTYELTRPDPKTGIVGTELYTVKGDLIAGDPQLHSHNLIPNLMRTESGRLVAINRDLLDNRVKEFGGIYQMFLASELRKAGFEAKLDERTLMAEMPAVPKHVSEAFSKRTNDAQRVAKEHAARDGLDWDAMSGDDQARWLKTGALQSRNKKAELSDVTAWRAQADALNYHPATFRFIGPVPPPITEGEKLNHAKGVSLPLLADDLTKRAVIGGGDVRLAAVRGLIEWGGTTAGVADIDKITKDMARNGVMQDAQRTELLWRVDDRGRVRVTTELHKGQEEELIALAKRAHADTSSALTERSIAAAVGRAGIVFKNDEHGESQRKAIYAAGQQGSLAVVIGSAGSGKTTAAKVWVNAWAQEKRDVWGLALSWRQAGDLSDAGIDKRQCRAIQPFLDGVGAGKIKLNANSRIVLDELGQIGTRQLLDLLRIRDQTGAKIVAMGDDRQCQSIEAGPVIKLLTEALPKGAIPEIFATIRQNTAAERAIVDDFRAGRVAEAVGAKRANHTAELVPGGYRQAVNRVADLWAERRQANPTFSVTISAPTNEDAREIGRAVREQRRRMGEVGPDRATVQASDGRGDSYNLRLAEGDNVRLLKRMRGVFYDAEGRKRSISVGDNGSVLQVVSVDPAKGLKLRTANGHEAFVAWSETHHRGSNLAALTYGDCRTIDSSQGITSDEHIHAFPSGSASVQGFKNYVAQSRHRVQSFMVGSEGAEMRGALAARPMGMPEPRGREAQDEAWAHVVKNFERVPVKESALAMLATITTMRRDAAKALQAGLRNREAHRAADKPMALGARLKRSQAAKVVGQVAVKMEAAVKEHQNAMNKVRQIVAPSAAPPAVRHQPSATPPAPSKLLRMRISETEAQSQLASFMRAHGLVLDGPPILDGQRHYTRVDGSKENKKGAYMAFYEGRRPAGIVWNYKEATKATWKADGETVPVDTAEMRAMREAAEAKRLADMKAQAERESKAAREAQATWASVRPAGPGHPYLAAKGVQPHGIGVTEDGKLVIPLRTADGKLWNLQTITADGTKRPVTGARVLETFFLMGKPEPGKPLLIAEGFATAATVHELSGAAVAVALNTSNLAPVTRALRAAYPDAQLAMAADNDAHLPLKPVQDGKAPLPNIGVKKAAEIAAEVGARMLIAPEIVERTRAGKGTDWNDYAATRGVEATRAALRQAWKAAEAPSEGAVAKPQAPRLRA